MSEMDEFVLVEVFHDGRLAVSGQPVAVEGHPDAYSAAISLLGTHAAQRGNRVLAKGFDHSNGDVSWFYVNERGEAYDAFGAQGQPSGQPSGPQDQPDTVQTPVIQPKASQPEPSILDIESELEATRQRPRDRDFTPAPSFEPYLPDLPTSAAPQSSVLPSSETAPQAPISEVPPAAAIYPDPAQAPGWPEAPQAPSQTAPQAPAPVHAPSQQLAVQPQAQAVPAASGAAPESRAANRQFVRPPKERPTQGLRRAVYSASGGTVNLGMSAREREEAALEQRISRQLHGSHTTAVLSLKGGIGKTSTTVGVGMMLAEYRGDPPCAIDANPDSGDLAERALGEHRYQPEGSHTISEVLRNIDSIGTLTELSHYMHHANRLHLIAGEQDPALSDALTAQEYLRIQALISQYYSVVLTDCGTGVSHPAMSGILSTASNVVIAAGYAVSGAKRARSTLEWLAGHGYQDLARNAVVVITDKDEVSGRVDKRAIDAELSGQCKQLITVPHDRGVADGDQISLGTLRPATRRAYKEIAAAIVDGYL
ncbi:MinD-like ATPase involved in chromosome partitioning or flagellar assembly [Psychromicrobium silvestre]|uniref:MinD-like ATPase involved in chromosome partitioning or flagellar assembly n=1 Tax=Psychromicrobium silvestre TaxID=1645614 RepID=A0A7Y9LT06_9MICC|nr:MinD/ParA family protein [Psychromicrobium silvestre]NYE95051.1 MinD-like ATPase involved in chromosome partitioning or flagellar assembly [Psychromicrobium silvestre]